MSKKFLYTFTVSKKETIDKTEESTDNEGNKITITKKVEDFVPYRFHLLKPTRSILDNADLYFGVKLAEGIDKGLMPRALLIKKYANSDGIFSEKEKQRYSDLYKTFFENGIKIEGLNKKENKNEEDSRNLTQLEEKQKEIQAELIDYEQAKNSLFEHTAETWARNKVIIWWGLMLAYTEDKDGNKNPYFKGDSFEEKLKFLDEIDDKEDSFEVEVAKKFMLLASFWYNGRANTKEEFDGVISDFNSLMGA